MPEISISWPNLVQKAIVSVATLAALAVLGLVLAYWTWLWFLASHPEHPEPRSRLVPEWNGSVSTARNMFGVAKHEHDIVVPTTATPIKLLGVVAASGRGRGHAVMQLEENEVIAVPEGEDIVPGIRLAEVYSDRIVLGRDGLHETIVLATMSSSDTASISTGSNSLVETPIQ